MPSLRPQSNFSQLKAHDEQLERLFKREGGGFTRLDKIFNGELQQVLEAFSDALWTVSAA